MKAGEEHRLPMTQKWTAQALSDFLFSRSSLGPKHFGEPAPDAHTLELAARAAQAAPYHTAPDDKSESFPVTFTVIESRSKLADLFEATLPPEASDAERNKARSKAEKGACCIAVIARHAPESASSRCEKELAMTAGAALMNFLNVLHAAGFAAKTVSAKSFSNPAGLYDPSKEELLCFVLCGSPKSALSPRNEKPSLLKHW